MSNKGGKQRLDGQSPVGLAADVLGFVYRETAKLNSNKPTAYLPCDIS